MKKGLIQTVVIALFAALVVEGLIFVNFIYRIETIQRAVREAEIIRAINSVEFVKQALDNALTYSFYQGVYSTTTRGGYSDLSNLKSHQCIPYWRVYDETYYPSTEDVMKNIQETTLKIFNNYGAALSNELITVPSFTDISMTKEKNVFTVNVSSAEKIKLETENLNISDNLNFSKKIEIKFFDLFDKGKSNFIDKDSIKEAMQRNCCHCDGAKDAVKDALTNLANSLSSGDIKVEFDIEKVEVDVDCKSIKDPTDPEGKRKITVCVDCDAAARILVTITDKSNKYPVYDPLEQTTALRNIQLRFYVITGDKGLVDTRAEECTANPY
jgi:hypothetical protein